MKSRVDRRSMFYDADSKTFEFAKNLRRGMTITEIILWKKLKDREKFKVKFRRQHPISNYVVDFYCHEFKLAIEIDGEIHDSEENHEKDLNRTAELNRFGIKIIRFTNGQIHEQLDWVLTRIKEAVSFTK